jgi:hypothetical protein
VSTGRSSTKSGTYRLMVFTLTKLNACFRTSSRGYGSSQAGLGTGRSHLRHHPFIQPGR